MRTIGLIGGMSSFSSSLYYSAINRLVNERLGGSAAAELILYSINFDRYKEIQEQGNWKLIEEILVEIANKLEVAGAECILICSNTPHLVAKQVQEKIRLPLLHVATETAKEISKQGIKKVALLGTKFTMEHDFFKAELRTLNIETMIPDDADRALIHAVILTELTQGNYLPEAKLAFKKCIQKLKEAGAEAVVFACTEIILLLQQEECDLPIFDTTFIHSKAAVNFSLS